MQTFSKEERLSGKIALEQLFQTGKSFNSFPFKVIWLEVPASAIPVKVVLSAPKRLYKHAVDRNRIKRLMRESYRKNKIIVYDELKGRSIHLQLIYTSRSIIDYTVMEEKMVAVLRRLSQTIYL